MFINPSSSERLTEIARILLRIVAVGSLNRTPLARRSFSLDVIPGCLGGSFSPALSFSLGFLMNFFYARGDIGSIEPLYKIVERSDAWHFTFFKTTNRTKYGVAIELMCPL